MKPSDFEIYINSFKNENTRKVYFNALNDLYSVCRVLEPVKGRFDEHILQKACRLYLKDLRSLGRAKSTISRTIYIFNGFFKWGIKQELIFRNPMDHFDRIRLSFFDFKIHTLPENLNIEAMLNSIPQDSFKENNASLVLFLLAAFGLKRSEICNLKYGDFLDLEEAEPKLVIRNKKSYRSRVLKLTSYSVERFKSFFLSRDSFSSYKLRDDDFVLQTSFRGRASRPIDGSTVFRIVGKYLKEFGGISPSAFRTSKVLESIHTKKYYELGNNFGLSHKEISKYKVLDAKEKLDRESNELIEFLVKERLEEEMKKKIS